MKATQQLREEHQGIMVMLGVLEKISQQLKAGEDVSAGRLSQITEFLSVFVDQCHHGKEEELLFPQMEKSVGFGEKEMIRQMLGEHELGRERISKIKKDLEDYRNSVPGAARSLAESIDDYNQLLEEHITKETMVLFPRADQLLDEKSQQQLFEEFEEVEVSKIGAGRHEQFHKLLDELRAQYLEQG